MSRRRRGIYGQTVYYVSTALAAVGWWLRAVVMYPIYIVGDAWNLLFGGIGASLSRGSIGTRLLDAVLTVPSLVWHYTYIGLRSVGGAAQNWPSMMRLRDLAAGLPALLMMTSLVFGFFFLPNLLQSKQEVINSYQATCNDTYDELKKATDPKEQKRIEEKVLLYLRALSQINPDDNQYRFNIAQVYYMLGEVNRGQAIMQRLAPRDEANFPPAHIWLAQMMLQQAPETRSYEDALAHLEHALAKDPNQREVHWIMAQVYFELYLNYRPQPYSPWQPPRRKLLDDCEEHLHGSPQDNPQVQLMLGRVHAMQGKKDDAARDIASMVAGYQQVLKTKPYDLDTRLRLAQAYRDIGEFGKAVEVLQEGNRLKPDPQIDFELSMTFFMMADYQQKNVPNSLEHQYAALRLGYVAYPASPYIAARFVRGIVGSKDDADAARNSLLNLLNIPGVRGTQSRGMATFLLAFDAQRRNLLADSRRYLDDARGVTDDRFGNAVANLALASVQRRTDLVDPEIAIRLNDLAASVWPDNPNLQMVRGWYELKINKSFANALSQFLKALKYRADDPVLHSMLEETYRGLQQTQNAEKHKRLAEAAKVREQEMKQAKASAPIVISGAAPR